MHTLFMIYLHICTQELKHGMEQFRNVKYVCEQFVSNVYVYLQHVKDVVGSFLCASYCAGVPWPQTQ